MNTTENNKIIAEFMNWSDTGNKGIQWNWLMEVVEKIEKTHTTNYYDFETATENDFSVSCAFDSDSSTITVHFKNINPDKNRYKTKQFSVNSSGIKIESVYNACLEFIKWYNENYR